MAGFNKIVKLNNLTYRSSRQEGMQKRKTRSTAQTCVSTWRRPTYNAARRFSRLIYARLEERSTEALIDVVVIDPDKWQSVPIGRIDHQQMDLEAYFTQERLEELLVKYEAIAVIDDIFFVDHAKRDAITQGGLGAHWRRLQTIIDKFTWWKIKHNFPPRLPELVKMNNYTLTLRNGTQHLLRLIPSDKNKFSPSGTR